MKIESMRTRSYRSFKVDDADLPAEARERLSAIRRHDELRAAGCAEQAALREIGVSRRTMYRWKAAPDAGFPLGERRQSLVRMVPQASAPVREYADGRSKPRTWRHGSKLILCGINEAWCAAWLTRLDARPPATCRNCARDRLFQRLRPGASPDHPAWVRAWDGVLEWRSQRLSTTAGFSPPSATTRVVAGPRTLARVWATSPLARWTVIRSRPLQRSSSAAIRQSAFTATICGNRPDHSRRRDPPSP